MISTYFMAVGDRPVRSAARRDAVPSGKRRDAAGRSPTATGGRDKFPTGGVAIRLWCSAPRREPLLPGGEFLPGEIGRYHCRLVLGAGDPFPSLEEQSCDLGLPKLQRPVMQALSVDLARPGQRKLFQKNHHARMLIGRRIGQGMLLHRVFG